jgi:hypothetical protein
MNRTGKALCKLRIACGLPLAKNAAAKLIAAERLAVARNS